jgi:hypothetical protein
VPIITAAEISSDEYEDKIAPEGTYPLRIAKAEYGQTKGGEGKPKRDMVTAMLVIDGADGDGIQPFNEYLVLPTDNEETKTKRLFMQRLTRFLSIFGHSGDFDPEQAASVLTGLTAEAPVTQEEGNDGVMRNRLKLPRIGR